MADVQLEHGYFKVANRLGEAIIVARFASAMQYKILWAIVRLTYGWRRKSVRISHADLARVCGTRPSGAFRRALDELIKNRVVLEVQRPSGRLAGALAINKDFESWGAFAVAATTLDTLYAVRPVSGPENLGVEVDDDRRLYVYYGRDRGLVKIGVSSNPLKRVQSLRTARPEMQLVGVEYGPPGLETKRHAQFGAHRVKPDREWFRWCAEIEAHVESLQPLALTGSLSQGGHTIDSVPSGGEGAAPEGMGEAQEGSQEAVKSAGDIGMALRKAIVKDDGLQTDATTRAREEQRVAEPEPAFAVEPEKYAIGLTTAANNAITERWGESTRPLRWDQATQLSIELIQVGVPLELARRAIADCVRSSKNLEPPKSINYFANAITDAFKATQQRALDRENPAPTKSVRPSPISAAVSRVTNDGGADKSERERQLVLEYTRASNEAAITWGKDPANDAAFKAILASANEHYATMIETPWAQRMRDRAVLAECAKASGFPSFDEWLARGASERVPTSP